MISKYAASILFCFFVSAGFITVVADYKSTFLIGAAQYSTLSWLSDGSNNIWREKVIEKLNLGADLVQVYSGWIYEGPSMIKKINSTLLNFKKENLN